MGSGSDIVTEKALVTAVAQVQPLVWEIPHALGMEKKKKKERTRKKEMSPHEFAKLPGERVVQLTRVLNGKN